MAPLSVCHILFSLSAPNIGERTVAPGGHVYFTRPAYQEAVGSLHNFTKERMSGIPY